MKALVIALALLILVVLLTGCHHTSGAQRPVASSPIQPPQPQPVGDLRGIYLSGWAAGSPRLFAQDVALIDRTTLNAMVIDVKDAGQVSYAVDVQLAKEIGANRHMIRDIDGVIATLRAHHIFAIARIACFRDTLLALAHPELAIRTVHGNVWRDRPAMPGSIRMTGAAGSTTWSWRAMPPNTAFRKFNSITYVFPARE